MWGDTEKRPEALTPLTFPCSSKHSLTNGSVLRTICQASDEGHRGRYHTYEDKISASALSFHFYEFFSLISLNKMLDGGAPGWLSR